MPDEQVPGNWLARWATAAEVRGTPWQAARSHIVVPRIGLEFPRAMPFEVWVGVGVQLATVATSSAWCLGDWLVYGRGAYSSRYREVIERTGLDYQTLRNYAWVAGRFELSRRRDTLSFGHHAEAAALPEPEQDFWLRKAEEFRWSTVRLRREIRQSLAERRQEPVSLAPTKPVSRSRTSKIEGQPVTVRVTLTAGQLELCEQAARSEGMALHLWAARTLEQAAHDAVPNRQDKLAAGF